MQDFKVCFELHLFNEWSDCFTVLYVCLSLSLSHSLSLSSVSVSLALSPLSLPPPFSVSMCVWGWSLDFGKNYQLCTWQQHFHLFLLNNVFVFVLLCLLTTFYLAAANESYWSVSNWSFTAWMTDVWNCSGLNFSCTCRAVLLLTGHNLQADYSVSLIVLLVFVRFLFQKRTILPCLMFFSPLLAGLWMSSPQCILQHTRKWDLSCNIWM